MNFIADNFKFTRSSKYSKIVNNESNAATYDIYFCYSFQYLYFVVY